MYESQQIFYVDSTYLTAERTGQRKGIQSSDAKYENAQHIKYCRVFNAGSSSVVIRDFQTD
jgi:hypothetical protein